MTKLYIPVGVPGCGKSTAAAASGAKVLSSDVIRGEIFGDEAIQYDETIALEEAERQNISFSGMSEEEVTKKKRFLCNTVVFGLLDQRVHEALREGMDVFYDATNLSRKLRRNILSKFNGEYDEAVGILFDVPLETALKRNATRERHVPEDVIRRMDSTMEAPSLDEGFSEIRIIRS